jgi:alcohol dehydrogenase class IV
MAGRLRDHGADPARIDELVSQAMEDPCHKTNAVPVTGADFRKLYEEVL